MNQVSTPSDVPMWLKVGFTVMATTVIAVYIVELPLDGLLWFSDIALIVLVPALWMANRTLNSTMAVGVLLLEAGWVLDFFTGGNLTGIAAYMFEEERELHLNILSGVFHLALPPVILYLLFKLGYDKRAWRYMNVLALVVLPLSYIFSNPENNVNWVFGPGEQQALIHPWLYLGLLYLALVFVIYWPSHWVFKRYFATDN